MGMFDKPQYLTGEDGFVQAGDTFWLHAAKLDGQTSVAGGLPRDQAKLRVSLTKEGPTSDVWSSGAGIVNQVKRMTADDRASFPIELRLDQVPSKQGNPTNVMTPADQEAPTGSTADTEIAQF